jgi:hypothetical protein
MLAYQEKKLVGYKHSRLLGVSVSDEEKKLITSTTGRQLDQPPSEAKRDELHAGPDCRRSLASGIAKISACHRSGELNVDQGPVS